ncbi:MAG: hypothetical protein K2L52_04245 [Clostridia bacterium]|nr:hypothetical protein [Clostridia bacterium]
MTATEAILRTMQELADNCETLEEFRKALAKIIKQGIKETAHALRV